MSTLWAKQFGLDDHDGRSKHDNAARRCLQQANQNAQVLEDPRKLSDTRNQAMSAVYTPPIPTWPLNRYSKAIDQWRGNIDTASERFAIEVDGIAHVQDTKLRLRAAPGRYPPSSPLESLTEANDKRRTEKRRSMQRHWLRQDVQIADGYVVRSEHAKRRLRAANLRHKALQRVEEAAERRAGLMHSRLRVRSAAKVENAVHSLQLQTQQKQTVVDRSARKTLVTVGCEMLQLVFCTYALMQSVINWRSAATLSNWIPPAQNPPEVQKSSLSNLQPQQAGEDWVRRMQNKTGLLSLDKPKYFTKHAEKQRVSLQNLELADIGWCSTEQRELNERAAMVKEQRQLSDQRVGRNWAQRRERGLSTMYDKANLAFEARARKEAHQVQTAERLGHELGQMRKYPDGHTDPTVMRARILLLQVHGVEKALDEWKICKHRFAVDHKSSRDSGADGTVRSASGVKVWYQDTVL